MVSSVEHRLEGTISAGQHLSGATHRNSDHRSAEGDSPGGPAYRNVLQPEPQPRINEPIRPRLIPRKQRPRRRRLRYGILVAFLLLAAIPVWSAFSVWNDWRSLERESLDSAAFEELPEVDPASIAVEGEADQAALAVSLAPAAPVVVEEGDTGYQTFMIVGTDKSQLRADVIVLFMLPNDGSPPIMVSLPRDLYLPNRCTQSFTRINANFNGCGEINGATALSGAITDFTGYSVDHFAIFTFEGFAKIVDQLGGFEICVDHATRELDRFEVPAGCTLADGATTLGWIRSRKTQEYIDGSWRRVTNVSDLTRNERQRELILTVFKQAAQFSSPQEMTAVVSSMADAFVLDDGLGLGAAVDLAWNNRGLDPNTIIRPTIPVVDHRTERGAAVLIPTKSFQEVLDEALAG